MKRILLFLDAHFEEALMVLLLVALTAVTSLQIGLRVGNSALSWAEEFSRYCFVYITFLTIGYCVRYDTMLRLDLFNYFLSPAVIKVINFVITSICLVFYVYLTIHAVDLVSSMFHTSRTSPAMGIPFQYIYLSTVIGFALGAIRSMEMLIRTVLEWRRPAVSQAAASAAAMPAAQALAPADQEVAK